MLLIVITYTAQYKFLDDGNVHAEVGDFPGVITCGTSLDHARWMLQSALVDLAELAIERGEALPVPGETMGDLEFDLDEPIHLVLSAARKVVGVPEVASL